MSTTYVSDGSRLSNDSACDNSKEPLLAAIAYEELKLAYIIHNEAEIVKSALDSLRSQKDKKAAFVVKELIAINRITERRLKDIIMEEMLLQTKLESALGSSNEI